MIFDSKGKMHQSQEAADAANREYARPEHVVRKETDEKLVGMAVVFNLIGIPIFTYGLFLFFGLDPHINSIAYTWIGVTIASYVAWVVGLVKFNKRRDNFADSLIIYGMTTFVVIVVLGVLAEIM